MSGRREALPPSLPRDEAGSSSAKASSHLSTGSPLESSGRITPSIMKVGVLCAPFCRA